MAQSISAISAENHIQSGEQKVFAPFSLVYKLPKMQSLNCIRWNFHKKKKAKKKIDKNSITFNLHLNNYDEHSSVLERLIGPTFMH